MSFKKYVKEKFNEDFDKTVFVICVAQIIIGGFLVLFGDTLGFIGYILFFMGWAEIGLHVLFVDYQDWKKVGGLRKNDG